MQSLPSDNITHSFDLDLCYLTESEICQLHCRFGYMLVNRLLQLITCAGHEPGLATLQYITKYCKLCQTPGKSPGLSQGRYSLQLLHLCQYIHRR